jgi:hypothetical protein
MSLGTLLGTICWQRFESQSTAFPQNPLRLCKTCSKQIFFARNINADSNLRQVEKKSIRITLICFAAVQ